MNLLLRIKTEKSQMTLDSISESWFMPLPCYICSVYKEKMLHFWRMLECIFVLIVVPLICIWAIWLSISKSWAWVPPEFHIFVYILYSSWALDFRTRGRKGFEVGINDIKAQVWRYEQGRQWQPNGCWALSRIRTKMIILYLPILNKRMCNLTPKLTHQMVTIIFLRKPPSNTH
jgi:hypothetical protein